MTHIYTVSDNVLNQFASELYRAAENSDGDYFRCEVEVEDDDLTYVMNFEGIPYFKRERVVDDLVEWHLARIVPTWSEVHTYDKEGEEVPNIHNAVHFTKTYLTNIYS